MAHAAEAAGVQFVISTGDNFYPGGVSSVDDSQWVTSFEDIYDASALMIPWYVTLGNHDHRGNILAQMEYANLSSRWRLPARNYKHSKRLADGSEADFFHIDTTPLTSFGSVWSNSQLSWLERELATSAASWKIVIGHHPVYAGSQRGGEPELLTLLEPLMKRFGVQAYICGHEHHMEHIVVGGVSYLVCGAGANARSAEGTKGTQFVSGDRLGFMTTRLSKSAMMVEFIDDQGSSLYRTRILRTPAQAR